MGANQFPLAGQFNTLELPMALQQPQMSKPQRSCIRIAARRTLRRRFLNTFVTLNMALCASSSLWANDGFTLSNKGAFSIVQHHDDKGQVSQVLRFKSGDQPEVVLESGINWSGIYYISPDDRWILRIQKTGSGDNTAYLYFLEDNGSVWRMEQPLDKLGFDYLGHRPKGLPNGLYHKGINFISWDMPKHLLHFSIHADSDVAADALEMTLTYRLLQNRIISP